MFQWEEGERRVRASPERPRLERAASAVVVELRRRLGSSFDVNELADFYGAGVDWASQVAERNSAAIDSSWVVDAAFYRYASGSTNFAGGRTRGTL